MRLGRKDSLSLPLVHNEWESLIRMAVFHLRSSVAHPCRGGSGKAQSWLSSARLVKKLIKFNYSIFDL